jgi:hypothetical protein
LKFVADLATTEQMSQSACSKRGYHIIVASFVRPPTERSDNWHLFPSSIPITSFSFALSVQVGCDCLKMVYFKAAAVALLAIGATTA